MPGWGPQGLLAGLAVSSVRPACPPPRSQTGSSTRQATPRPRGPFLEAEDEPKTTSRKHLRASGPTCQPGRRQGAPATEEEEADLPQAKSCSGGRRGGGAPAWACRPCRTTSTLCTSSPLFPLKGPVEVPLPPGSPPGPQAGPGCSPRLPHPSPRGPVHTVNHCSRLPGEWTVSLRGAGMGLGHPGTQDGHSGNSIQENKSGSWEPRTAFLGAQCWKSCPPHPHPHPSVA